MENFVLFIQLTAISFCSAFSSHFIKKILPFVAIRTSEESSLFAELKDIKLQLAGMSMVDEFAKYAKLQRRAIKLQDALNEKANIRLASTLKVKLILNYLLHFLLAIVLLFMSWNHKYDPVLYIPEDWFYPFGGLLSWPTGQSGVISVLAWLLISGTSLRALAAAVS